MFIYSLLKKSAGCQFVGVIWLMWQVQPGDMPNPEEFDAEDDLENDSSATDDAEDDEADDLLTDEEDDISISADEEE